MMTIQRDKVVTLHYHLTDHDGQVIESSRNSEPLIYLHGTGELVFGLEQELTGLNVGATKTVQIAAADGYGEYSDDLVQHIPLQALAGLENINVGTSLKGNGPDGETVTGVITSIQNDVVTLDTNHPLAGVNLTFDLEILAVRDASAEEIEHGHVHDDEGHAH